MVMGVDSNELMKAIIDTKNSLLLVSGMFGIIMMLGIFWVIQAIEELKKKIDKK